MGLGVTLWSVVVAPVLASLSFLPFLPSFIGLPPPSFGTALIPAFPFLILTLSFLFRLACSKVSDL